jgi:hypothetical protein
MKITSLQSNSLKLAFTGLLGAAAIISAPGQALASNPITLTGQAPASNNGIYTIKYINGPWTTVGPQVVAGSLWWGDANLASSLSVMLAGSPVFPGPVTVTNTFTNSLPVENVVNANVLFATSSASILGGIVGGVYSAPNNNYMTAPGFLVDQNTSFNWAVAMKTNLPSTPTPGPLPLVGAAAAFGFSRRLRSRINKSAIV